MFISFSGLAFVLVTVGGVAGLVVREEGVVVAGVDVVAAAATVADVVAVGAAGRLLPL